MRWLTVSLFVVAAFGAFLASLSSRVWDAKGYDFPIAPAPFDWAAIFGFYLGWIVFGLAITLLILVGTVTLLRRGE